MLSCNLSSKLFKDKKLELYEQALHPVQGSFKEGVNMVEWIETVFQIFVALTFRKTARQRMKERGNSVTWTSKYCHLKSSVFMSYVKWKRIPEHGWCLRNLFEVLLLTVREHISREKQSIILVPKKTFNSPFVIEY